MDLVIFFCAWAQECKKIRFETGGLCQDIKASPKPQTFNTFILLTFQPASHFASHSILHCFILFVRDIYSTEKIK